MFKVFLAAITGLIIQSNTQDSTTKNLDQRKLEKCIGLALKGGANRGSYEAGAIHALV